MASLAKNPGAATTDAQSLWHHLVASVHQAPANGTGNGSLHQSASHHWGCFANVAERAGCHGQITDRGCQGFSLCLPGGFREAAAGLQSGKWVSAPSLGHLNGNKSHTPALQPGPYP